LESAILGRLINGDINGDINTVTISTALWCFINQCVIICTRNTTVMLSAGIRMMCLVVVVGLSDCSSTYRHQMVFCSSEKSAKL